jgi:hypothetical protein
MDGTITGDKRPDLTNAARFSGTFTKPETYWR